MPPHSWDEWAAFFGIMTACVGVLVWIINIWIIQPLRVMIDNLTDKLGTFNKSLDIVQNNLDSIEEKYIDLERRLYGVEIKLQDQTK